MEVEVKREREYTNNVDELHSSGMETFEELYFAFIAEEEPSTEPTTLKEDQPVYVKT